MRLTKRDKEIFLLLDKFRMLNIKQISSFMEFGTTSTCQIRLRKLYDNGYINRYRKDIYTPLVYYLKQKGMNIIHEPEKKLIKDNTTQIIQKNPATFVIAKINHELLIADIVYKILCDNRDLSLDDIILDREQMQIQYKKKIKTHIPDIYIKKYRFICELEINQKKPVDLLKNIRNNRNNYQLWIVPKNKRKLRERITEFSSSMSDTFINIIDLESYNEFDFDLANFQNLLYSKNPNMLEKLEKIEKLKQDKELQLSIDDL